MPPVIGLLWWALPRMHEYMKSYPTACVGGAYSPYLCETTRTGQCTDEPGVQPTRLGTRSWRVRKGQPTVTHVLKDWECLIHTSKKQVITKEREQQKSQIDVDTFELFWQ